MKLETKEELKELIKDLEQLKELNPAKFNTLALFSRSLNILKQVDKETEPLEKLFTYNKTYNKKLNVFNIEFDGPDFHFLYSAKNEKEANLRYDFLKGVVESINTYFKNR